jgi:ribosome-associated protein
VTGAPDNAVVLAPGVWLPLDEVTWRFSSAGGPGGQHVNTSNTRAEATFDIAGSPTLPEWARERLMRSVGASVSVAAGDTRSQSRNRDLAVERLANRLARALVVAPARRPTRPTRASQRRRIEEKRRRGQLKSDRRSERDRGED